MHPAQIPVQQLLAACEIRRQRRSGPGGQHRNKVETGIFIEHKPTGVRAEATERRSQPKNQELAIFRLRLNLALNHRTTNAASSESVDASSPASDNEIIVSDLWRSRVRGGKLKVNDQHDDFPALLAEALDRLHDQHWDTRSAAETLGCSTSQLVKFLKQEPRAIAMVNRERESRGLGKLK